MGVDRAAGRYIAVEGPIGVGKTALARRLANEFGVPLVLEQGDDNPFLRRFYEEPRKYAFQAQLFFLLERYRQQQDLEGNEDGGVADYLFARDSIFAAVTLEADELALYNQVYTLLGSRIRKPDLVIYLEARPDVLLRRIRKRDRDAVEHLEPRVRAAPALHLLRRVDIQPDPVDSLVLGAKQVDGAALATSEIEHPPGAIGPGAM